MKTTRSATSTLRKWATDFVARLDEFDRLQAAVSATTRSDDPIGVVRGRRAKRRFSVDAKKRMSAGMRKYWARRKAAKAAA